MTRVLFIGLDAADRDLARHYAETGIMPVLRDLAASGATCDIVVPDAFYVGAVWPSFFTACAPTRHGRYCFKQYVPGTYRMAPVASDFVQIDPFWSALDAAGRRVVVLDIPKSRPVPLRHGIQICDWGTHDPERPGLVTTPAALAADIVARDGEEPVGNCDRIERTSAGFGTFTDSLKARILTKERMALRLMAEREWDFFAVCFGDSHCVGHQCWHLHDAGHERHDPRIAAAVGDPVRDIYGALDASVGRLIAAAGDDCLVFVMCSHGMGRHYDGGHLIKTVLRRINSRMPFGRSRVAQHKAYPDVRNDPKAIAENTPLQDDGLPVMASRRSFVVPNNDAFVGIRLNLVGREQYGRIRLGEAEAYGEALMGALRELTIGEGGPKAFERVFRTDAAYPQRAWNDDALPDIIAAWSRLAPYRALYSPSIGTIEGAYQGVRTGDHRAGGRLHVAGRGLGANATGELPIESVGPTICAALGVALANVDGHPMDLSDVHAAPAAARAIA